MTAARTSAAPITAAELGRRLGNIPISRIRFDPLPGTATVRDAVEIRAREGRSYELVDGVLVEKAMAFNESLLAAFLIRIIGLFADRHRLGKVGAPDAMMSLFPGMIRLPDVPYISRKRLASRPNAEANVAPFGPELAIEVFCPGNSEDEMERKRGEYFAAGAKAVWVVYPRRRTIEAYSPPAGKSVLREGDVLDGGEVLPGFRLPVSDVFAEWDDIVGLGGPAEGNS